MTRIDTEFVISTGEKLWEMSTEELNALRTNSGRLLERIARSSHYRRKNRTNVQCLENDLALIDCELERRNSLNKLTLCGLEFRFKKGYALRHRDAQGKQTLYERTFIFEIARDSSSWATSTLELSDKQFRLALANGAKWEKEPDPLAPPWRVLAEDPNTSSGEPWAVLDFDPEDR